MSNYLLDTVFKGQLDKQMTFAEAFDILDSRNLISHGELAEQAISQASGVLQCSKNTPGIDLVNGLQIKYAATNYKTQSYAGRLKAHISIQNHTETILAVVTETKTKVQYFFVFPFHSYRHLSGNTFAVPFDLNGNPKRIHWSWGYQLKDWEALVERAKQG